MVFILEFNDFIGKIAVGDNFGSDTVIVEHIDEEDSNDNTGTGLVNDITGIYNDDNIEAYDDITGIYDNNNIGIEYYTPDYIRKKIKEYVIKLDEIQNLKIDPDKSVFLAFEDFEPYDYTIARCQHEENSITSEKRYIIDFNIREYISGKDDYFGDNIGAVSQWKKYIVMEEG
jgi:predicted membrane-bound dolichyl-phosphate-mannose-protein mannosyltransferase